MIKRVFSILLMLITFSSWASDKVSVSVSPSQPVVNEPFELIFKIKLKGEEEPYISFDPGGASVTGRSNRGVSLKTTIINGKFTTTKEVTYVYNLISTRRGSLYIKNIKVDFGNSQVEKLKNIRLNVLREPQKPKDIFVLAIPSKTEVYVGEGFDVNYYLYHRVNVLGSELEKYPTLGDFLKRFHLVNETIETVRYKGELYRRSLKYSARLFAQKSGKAKVDPLKMKVQYSSGRNRGSFGFGIQLGQVRTRSFQSKKVEVNVLPLPTENVPPYFSGLVGEHEFNLQIPRTKYVVNEAIEAKLEVKGVGALEAYEAPKILNHKDLEEFDTKGEIQAINKQVQKKLFDYTYLARSAFNIAPHTIKVAYFDPDKKEYITKEIEVPGVSISGGAVKSSSYTNNSNDIQAIDSELTKDNRLEQLGLVGLNLGKVKSSNSILIFLNSFLVLLLLIVTLLTFFIKKQRSTVQDKVRILIKDIYSGKLSFSNLYSLLNLLSLDLNRSVRDKVEGSHLTFEAKKYFLDLLEGLERGTYSNEEVSNGKIKKKYFKELQQEIK